MNEELETFLLEATKMKEEDAKASKYLTRKDKEILTLTARIISLFRDMKQTHPSDMDNMVRAIHDIQSIIAVRVARRAVPTKFLTYKEE